MAFRVEYAGEAEADLNGILDWLISQHAGQAGLRWFDGLEDAVASLSTAPQRCPLAAENKRFPFEVRHLSMAAIRMCTASSSPSKATGLLFSTFGTDAAAKSANRAECKGNPNQPHHL